MTFTPREYQVRIINAQDSFIADSSVSRATILAATGAGKTECFNDLIIKMFLSGERKRILIAHPRIALSQNQQRRMVSRLKGFDVEFTSFHSGQQKYHTLKDRKNVSTTGRDDLTRIMDEAEGHHITFSSYKSLAKIADMDFDLIICDEAHNLVQSDLRECLDLFQSKTLFYTGTPVNVAAQDASMDNINLFGFVVANIPPSELIPYGYIVRPMMYFMDIKNKKIGNTPDYVTAIAEAYKQQVSLSHEKFVHKLLVSMPATHAFDEIMEGLNDIRNVVGNNDLDLYYVTALTAVKNGRVMDDREALIKDFDNNINQSIIVHCDTLAEGIDVDGIGGVLIMRGLGMTKAIQTIGRAARAAKQDIKKNGEIRKNRIKKHCVVTVAYIDGESVSDIDLEWWVNLFREAGYGDLWNYVNPTPVDRGAGAELGERNDIVFDLIQDIKFREEQDKEYEIMFEPKHA